MNGSAIKWRKIQTDFGLVYAWGEYRAFWCQKWGKWKLEDGGLFPKSFRTLREAKDRAEANERAEMNRLVKLKAWDEIARKERACRK